MKYCVLVGDGMGDFPLAELDGRTVLEAAFTPSMDELCQKGEFFLNHTVPEGFPPGSDVANMSLLGYNPADCYTGRAPLEAAAMNITLARDELAFRCNLVTLDQENGRSTMRDFCAGHITNEEAHQLIRDIEKQCATDRFHFYPGVGYRHLMVFQGEHPGFETVPPHDHIGRDVSEFYDRYLSDATWTQLLQQVRDLLENHPINLKRIADGKNPASFIWLWGEGASPTMLPLSERFNITGTMISAVDLLKGLGVLGGLDVAEVEGATGYIDTNYEGKAKAAIDALKTQDFAFVHLEAPDEAGHQGSLKDKIKAIEDFDSRIVAPITQALRDSGEDFRMVVTMDHFTPLSLKTHVSNPVPTILYDSRENTAGSGLTFSEKNCNLRDKEVSDSMQNGSDLMARLLEQ